LGDRQGSYRFVGAGPYEGKYQVEGRLSVNPVRIEGSFSTTGTQLSRLWKHLEDQVSFQIVKGSAEVSGNYAVAVTNGRLDARLQNGSLDIKDFQLTEKGKEMVLISVPSLTVEGIDADVENREIVVDQVRSVDGKIQSWLAPDGTLKLRSVLLPHGKKSADKEEPEPSETDEPPSRPWYATVNTVELNNWGAAIEDRTLPKPARFSFDDVTLTVDRLSNKKGAQAEAALALRINRAGAVHVRGAASMDPLAADLSVDLDKIALKSFQAYIDTAVDAQIDSGTVGTKGRLLYRGEQSQPQIRYEGELSLDDFGLNDRRKPEDFIKLAQLKISGVGLELLPNRLQVAQVLISEPYARVTIDQNGTVNVVQTFSPAKKGAENTKGEQNLLQRVADALIFQFKGPMPLKIDLVKLENFSGDLIDGSITPNFTTRLDINTATVKGLSSEPTAQADFRIDGTIAPSASLQIAGQMNPLSALQYTQVDLDLKDFDLKTVSPYSAKYVGYQIDQGKLGLKLAYLVDKDAIDGKNRIDIDQLTLGKKVDSPDAPDLPIALGVSLLKGADGRITLELPVKGNLGDPKYNIGEALTGSLTETITDAGSSPFTTISEVDGFKGEDLRFIEFEPGRSELTSLSRRKLDALSQYLAGRDALKLEIEGTADRQMDGNSIAGQETEKHPLQTRQTRAKTQQAESAKSQTVDDPALEQLARARADQVKTYLTGNGKVPSERVSLKQPRIKGAPDGNKSGAELFLLPR
jgi:outer membrane protein OmpA-like peptidoglycan-associated protein